MNRQKRSWLIVLLLAAGSAAIWLWATAPTESSAPPTTTEAVINVRALSVQAGEHRPLLFLIGEVEARDYIAMAAPLSAEVLSIQSREGEFFRKGEQLFVLDLREQKLLIDIQQAAVEEIRLQLDALTRNRAADAKRFREIKKLLFLAEKEHARDRELLSKDVIAASRFEASEQSLRQRRLEFLAMENQLADYETQQLRLQTRRQAAQAQLQQTNLLYERAQMRAPFSGRVAKLQSGVGARPAIGERLIEIFDPSRLRLRVSLPQRYSALAGGGETDALLTGGDGKEHLLTLSGFEPSVDSGDGGIDIFFDLPSEDWVLGATWQVIFRLPPVLDAVALPVDAIYNDHRVYRIDGQGRARLTVCERLGVGRDGAAAAVLLRCPTLGAGDKIIANQLPNIVDSAKVRISDS